MVTIELKGRIDTANALVVEKEIEEQITADTVTGLVFDCKELKYISSTGLRIILIISAAAIVRSISWVALGSFPQEVIDGVRKIADERLWPNREYYISIANKFAEFFPGS